MPDFWDGALALLVDSHAGSLFPKANWPEMFAICARKIACRTERFRHSNAKRCNKFRARGSISSKPASLGNGIASYPKLARLLLIPQAISIASTSTLCCSAVVQNYPTKTSELGSDLDREGVILTLPTASIGGLVVETEVPGVADLCVEAQSYCQVVLGEVIDID